MSKITKNVHMALQGGGSHGAFTWGILDKILEDGRLNIDGLCATSAGSMNAVLFSYGRLKGGNEGAREILHNFWQDVSKAGHHPNEIPTPMDSFMLYWNLSVFDAISHAVSPYQFNPTNSNILRDILSSHVDFEELRKGKSTNLFISATTVRTGKVRVFNTAEISLDVVMASACLPYLFQAVKVDDEYYWDGGYTGNPAIFPLFYHGDTNDVIIVHINPMVRSKLPVNSNEIMNRINEITFNSSLLSEFRAIAFVKKIIKEGWIKDEFKHNLRNIFVHSIRADQALQDFNATSKFDTHWHFLTNLRDLGRIEAKIWLDENFSAIGNKSTVNLRKDFLDEHTDGII
ncbi:MAG: patatin-like phospholipase family protein [Rickettsiales bacterium]